VGHTHIDIDQYFSVWASFLRTCLTFALSWVSLVDLLHNAFRHAGKRPKQVELLDRVYQWRAYFEPYLDPQFARFGCSQASGDAIHRAMFRHGPVVIDGRVVPGEMKVLMYYKK